jgi:hypothetical protein
VRAPQPGAETRRLSAARSGCGTTLTQAALLPEHPALQSLLHTATDPRRGVAMYCSPLRRTIDTACALYATLSSLTPTTLTLKPFLAEVGRPVPCPLPATAVSPAPLVS